MFGPTSKLILILVLCVICTVAQTPTPSPSPTPKPLNREFKKIHEDYSEALEIIHANHFSGGRLKAENLTTASMDYLLQHLDPHSNYLDKATADEFRQNLNARYFGIGVSLLELHDANNAIVGVFIREAFEGGPSERAGLRFGDEIVEIDGHAMNGKDFFAVRSRLMGPQGTKVIVVVERNGQKIRNEIIRDAIPTLSIPDAYMIRPGIGYVAMTQFFTRTTHAEFTAALAKLRAAGMRSLILDIRDNSGGLARQACLSASEFIPLGERIYEMRGRRNSSNAGCISANANADITTPIVAMVNSNTVSSAEIMSGGLQDTDRAFFIGETTYGKGLLQDVFELEGGSRIHLTTERFVTATGRMPQRDYSDGSLYRYLRDKGRAPNSGTTPQSSQPGFKTKTGRILFGGRGITPDVVVHSAALTSELRHWRTRLDHPVFAFIREVVGENRAGLETYRIDKPAVFGHDLMADEFLVTDDLYQAFKTFAAERYKIDAGRLDANRPFVDQRLRTELVVAAYGGQTALRVANASDTQLLRAIEMLPKAAELLQRSFPPKK